MTGEYEKLGGFPPELTLDARPGPASHLTQAKADAMIEHALLAAGFGAAPQAQVIPLAQASSKRTRRMPIWQVAAAALVAFAGLGSASAAVMWFAKRSEPTVEQLAPKLTPRKRHVAPIQPPAAEAPVVAPTPITLDEIALSAPPDEKTRSRKPEDWLEDANRLRAQKRWKEADESYARVWQSAPNSDAAYVARVASASVRLDHLHDAKAALARYRSALKVSPSGPLSEEARYGISEAYRGLGDRRAELAALREFMARHPNAGLATRVKRRMLELEAKP